MLRKKIILLTSLGFGLFALIRFSQYYLEKKIPSQGIFYFNNFFGLRPQENFGLAYGLPMPRAIIIILTAVIIIFLISLLLKYIRESSYDQVSAVILILVGAFSNILERIKYGYVMDFFSISFLPIFNLADIVITIGTIWLIANWWLSKK